MQSFSAKVACLDIVPKWGHQCWWVKTLKFLAPVLNPSWLSPALPLLSAFSKGRKSGPRTEECNTDSSWLGALAHCSNLCCPHQFLSPFLHGLFKSLEHRKQKWANEVFVLFLLPALWFALFTPDLSRNTSAIGFKPGYFNDKPCLPLNQKWEGEMFHARKGGDVQMQHYVAPSHGLALHLKYPTCILLYVQLLFLKVTESS